MRGLNIVVLSGKVGTVQFGVTHSKEEEVCSFTIAMEKTRDMVTWARINVYGGNVISCRKYLNQGIRVEVQGELMNRYSPAKDDKVLEIRCLDVKFLDWIEKDNSQDRHASGDR